MGGNDIKTNTETILNTEILLLHPQATTGQYAWPPLTYLRSQHVTLFTAGSSSGYQTVLATSRYITNGPSGPDGPFIITRSPLCYT